MNKKDKDKNPTPRQGSVGAEDNELMEWLHAFWHRKEAPEKIEVWLLTGPLRDIRTSLIFQQDFKANEDKNPEECAHLANVILSTARHDCNTTQRKSCYEVAIIDRHRSSHPIVRRIGPILPTTTHLTKAGQNGAQIDPDEEEVMLGAKPMILQYLDRLIAMVERKDQALNAITGDLLLHQSRENAELRNDRNGLQDRNMQMFFAIQEALDRKEDRDDRREDRQVQRTRDKLFADGLREAGRLVGVYAPGLMRALLPQNVVQQDAPPAPTASTASAAGKPPDFGQSEERAYVEQFFRYIKDVKVGDVSVAEKLLGDWIEVDGNMQPNTDPVKAGILTPDQVGVLVSVGNGWCHPDRIDELSPDSGHANAITGEQLMQAQAIVPQSAMAAVFELLGLRADKREKAAAAKTNTAP